MIGVCGACTVPLGAGGTANGSPEGLWSSRAVCSLLECLQGMHHRRVVCSPLEALQELHPAPQRGCTLEGTACSSLEGLQALHTTPQWNHRGCTLEVLCAAPQRGFTLEGLCAVPLSSCRHCTKLHRGAIEAMPYRGYMQLPIGLYLRRSVCNSLNRQHLLHTALQRDCRGCTSEGWLQPPRRPAGPAHRSQDPPVQHTVLRRTPVAACSSHEAAGTAHSTSMAVACSFSKGAVHGPSKGSAHRPLKPAAYSIS